MKTTTNIAARYPAACWDPDMTQRTIELGRALRAQQKRRRNSVTITVDASAVDAAMRGTLHSTARRAA